jgi:hypothetical protein
MANKVLENAQYSMFNFQVSGKIPLALNSNDGIYLFRGIFNLT